MRKAALCVGYLYPLMSHLRIGPYKEGVAIVQIQMPFYPIMRSWTLLSYELLVIRMCMQYSDTLMSVAPSCKSHEIC